MNAYFESASLQTAQPVRPRTHGWTIRRDANFFNDLCKKTDFPYSLFSSEVAGSTLPEALTGECQASIFKTLYNGFLEIRAHYHYNRYNADLTKSEMKILQAIERKTLNFGKLFEKIPYRFFVDGQLDESGELALDVHSLPVLPPTGIRDKGNISRAVSGLVSKGMITRIEADAHSIYGVAVIMSPIQVEAIRDIFKKHLEADRVRNCRGLASELHMQMTDKAVQVIDVMAASMQAGSR